MKIVKLNENQFNNYASNHRYRNYFQTPMYGKIMAKYGYRCQFLGFVDEYNKLAGATLLLYKEIWHKNKIAYTPRGPLLNYEDPDIVSKFVDKLRETLGKQNFMLLRIDPYVPLNILDNEGNVSNYNAGGNDAIENLKNAGFNYKGKNLFFETEKPRFEALIVLQRDENEIFDQMDKRTRNKIRKAVSNGLAVVQDEKKDLMKLYSYVGKKDKKPFDYYQTIVENFEDNAEVYYAKIKTEHYLINSRKNYEKEQEYNNTLAEKIQDISLNPKERNALLNKKIESDRMLNDYKNNLLKATDLLRNKPEGIIVGGALVIKYDNAAYIFTEGVDEKYSMLNAGYLLKWELIKHFNELGFKYINLNAVVGDFESTDSKDNPYIGLNEAKLGFNSLVTEYIGEFDLILNPFSYKLYNKMNK